MTLKSKKRLINGIDTLAWLLLIVFTAANSWKAALVFVGAFAAAWLLEWFLTKGGNDE
ncbi:MULTISPECIES: hypothetical protein [Bacillati]|jgi:hypothetical protein|uniref:hypothetical protein n=1 Tax=Bacillati TaxID=1783272 RepID=UPI0028F43244|nr:hypothetical protein [Streptomyces sp. P17]MDG4868752.1 hypothetical protein [Guyparkeria sp. 1SP6A2]MDT9700920.1 hypothetical protein [Streptomyces sp. P17]